MAAERFWESTPLADMSREQWESLCDGCARCCLHKLEDAYSGEIYYTSVACHLLNPESCRCGDYAGRRQKVPDCIVLTPQHCGAMDWLPETCAYRRLDEGKALPEWHPLISGDPNSVHEAGISVHGRTVNEEGVHDDDLENYIITWVPPVRRIGSRKAASDDDA
jgi:uncharacterized cysteine cluster protein YcgN (CxxCxxCC family)